MYEMLASSSLDVLAASDLLEFMSSTWSIILILVGFSVVVFFHELGHFAVAKWTSVRVERFAVGFGPELFGYTRGETRYSFNILPLGGYVKMLGQEDFEVDKSGEIALKDDPKSFSNKPVGLRMAVVSAGVVMNLIVAALLFMVVYMVGKTEVEPVVGYVIPEKPAAKAGLQVGDRILSINGAGVDNFNHVLAAVRLAKEYRPLLFEIKRGDQILTKSILPRRSDMNWLQVGFAPSATAEIVLVSEQLFKRKGPHPRRFDVIKEVNGQRIDKPQSPYIWDLMLQGRNRPSRVVVERPDREHPEAPAQLVEFAVDKFVAFEPTGIGKTEPRDLLGLIPRVRVTGIRRKSSAHYSGLQEGDVIVRWGNERHPTPGYIWESIEKYADKDIPVRVRRDGRELPRTLFYRARVARGRNGRLKPVPGFSLKQMEQDQVVLAGVVDYLFDRPTPSSEANLTKGCRLTEVNGGPIEGWADLAEKFREGAGSTVELTYLADNKESPETTSMTIPESLSTILGLPSYSGAYQQLGFFALDGRTDIYVQSLGQRLPAFYWLAIREYLSSKIGQEVEVTFKDEAGQIVTHPVEVRQEMINPWYRRVAYGIPEIRTKDLTYVNRKTNPLAAVWAGTKETYYFVVKTYQTLQRWIFDHTVSTEHMSGPVGIIHIGSRIAKADKIEMLYFLALLSANLAVINFLPLPIVDGGLMVFLLIEKLKGSPVSLRIQVATQMVGLALIASLFVFLTYQDIYKWIS